MYDFRRYREKFFIKDREHGDDSKTYNDTTSGIDSEKYLTLVDLSKGTVPIEDKCSTKEKIKSNEKGKDP